MPGRQRVVECNEKRYLQAVIAGQFASDAGRIPRVDMYAVANSISLPNIAVGDAKSIKDLGMRAGRLMASYTAVLNHEDLYASELRNDTKMDELEVGSYWFSAPANFRSKKINDQVDLIGAWKKLESTIYRKFDGWKLFCLIDPRWITTTTAHVTMSGGTLTAMGVTHINQIDQEKRVVLASPLFLGAPESGPSL